MSTNVIVSKSTDDASFSAQDIQVYKKVIWKLIPFLCFCYIAAYLDRSMSV